MQVDKPYSLLQLCMSESPSKRVKSSTMTNSATRNSSKIAPVNKCGSFWKHLLGSEDLSLNLKVLWPGSESVACYLLLLLINNSINYYVLENLLSILHIIYIMACSDIYIYCIAILLLSHLLYYCCYSIRCLHNIY